MSYNLKYTSDFKTIRDEIKSYRVEILEKDYGGLYNTIYLGADPVIQEWQDEWYKTPVRGCSLMINIINDGTISINDFYSEEDNKFKVILTDLSTSTILFQGFVVQDDCQELQVDFAHTIQISATDNLGLLKDINFSDALKMVTNPVAYYGVSFSNPISAGVTSFFTDEIAFTTLAAGTIFTIDSGSMAGTYTFISASIFSPGTYIVNVIEPVAYDLGYTSDLFIEMPLTLTSYTKLSDILKVCLKATNLNLNVRVLSQLYPKDSNNERWLDDTYIEINTFNNNDDFDDCYTIIDKIMSRFSATLFQAYGFWYIVRWGEFYRYSTVDGASFGGYVYDNNLTFISTYTSINNHNFKDLFGDLETGLLKSINRPIKYAKETFNYSQRPDLILNANLEEKGNLLNTYEDGEIRTMESYYPGGIDGFRVNGDLINLAKGQTIRISGSGAANGNYTVERVYVFSSTQFIILVKESVPSLSSTSKNLIYRQIDEYDLPYWIDYDVNPIPSPTRIIRKYSHIDTDIIIDTFIVVTGNAYDQGFSGQSNDIQLSAGDSILYSFDYRTDISQPGNVNNVFKVRIKNNDNYLYCDNIGTWQNPGSFVYNVPSGDNTNQWHTVTIESVSVPYDCILNVYLAEATSSTGDETHIKNFKLEIFSSISGTDKINGQTHTDTQFVNIKKLDDKEIFLDDCIKPYLKGTLFLEDTLENLRQRTINWNYNGASLSYPLGHITTLENLFQNYYAKDIYNGKHLKIANNDGDIMSPVSVLKDAQDAELKRYVFGALSINYREGTADFTMYEVDNSDITIAAFSDKNLYTFEYLYEK